MDNQEEEYEEFKKYMSNRMNAGLKRFDQKCVDAEIKLRLLLATTDDEVEDILMEAERFAFELSEEYLGTEEANKEAMGLAGVQNFHIMTRQMIDLLYDELGFDSMETMGKTYAQVLYLHGRPITFVAERRK